MMNGIVSPRTALLATGIALLVATGCRTMASTATMPVIASAAMRTPSGADAGTVDVLGGDGGLTLRFHLRGMAPGEHGVHLHAVGACDGSTATPFASAGAHLNPAAAKHGLQNPEGPHAGDLPNLTVVADGTAETSIASSRVGASGAGASLFDADGTAIVVHASSDDQRTDPSGNSGARVACGVVNGMANRAR